MSTFLEQRESLSVFVLLLALCFPCWSFQYRNMGFPFHTHNTRRTNQPFEVRIFQSADHDNQAATASDSTSDNATSTISNMENNEETSKKSFWKPKGQNTRWQERVHLNELHLGQELYGHVVSDLLEGKTGPKLFFDCGVGRVGQDGNWYMVNGMLRLPRTGKASVTRKRAAKFRARDRVPLYVSRIQKGCGRLEVCLTPEEVEPYQQQPRKVPVTSLQPNQIVEGTILKLHPYGATVDVGANRRGLLHIRKVAALYDRYIDKEKGLIEAGIEKGARVRLMVESVEQRRLFLDFTPDVKEAAAEELAKENKKKQPQVPAAVQEDLDEWAEYANEQAHVPVPQARDDNTATEDDDLSDDDDDEEYDDYDEESEIEEALGLDTY
jgi:predicted RNA-binding protein with RPS1 domain